MIELTGTEKQIKYATDIRNEMFYILDTVRNYYISIIEKDWSWRTKSKFSNFEDFKKNKIELLDKEFHKLFDEISDSKFFIENFAAICSYKNEYVTQFFILNNNFQYVDSFGNIQRILAILRNDIHKLEYKIFVEKDCEIA